MTLNPLYTSIVKSSHFYLPQSAPASLTMLAMDSSDIAKPAEAYYSIITSLDNVEKEQAEQGLQPHRA